MGHNDLTTTSSNLTATKKKVRGQLLYAEISNNAKYKFLVGHNFCGQYMDGQNHGRK